MQESIDINQEELQELKQKYEQAADEGRAQFVFKSKILLTSYAKYLIQYLDDKFKR
jgi:hypothetical protein